MQDTFTLARPYAKAAFEFALTHEAVSVWEQFLLTAEHVMKDPQIVAFQRNPDTNEEQLLELLQGVFGKTTDEFMNHFLKLLAKRKRLALLPTIARVYHDYKSEYEKQVDVDVFSVAALSPTQLQQLSQKLEARLHRKITIHQHLEPSLIGGMLVRAGDFVIDGSLRGRLRRLTYALTD